MTNLSTRVKILAPAAIPILFGAALIPYAGVQNDEALFAAPLYEQMPKEFCIRVFHHTIPLMVMSYLGNLKTLLYLPILHFLGSNLWTVRFPMVLAGGLTVFIFYKLLDESVGGFAALAGAFLLASDPTFILTDTYDWGPVALEHLLLVTACLCLLRFTRTGWMRYLAAGFFFLGLGLWNKAIFLWALSGLGVAGAAVFPRQLVKWARPRAMATAAAAFLMGALPLVTYNVRKPNATLGANAHFDSPQTAMRKVPMMIETLNGHGLFGFLCRSDWEEPAKQPGTLRGRLAWRIAGAVGGQYRNGFEFAFLLGLACAPWWWRRRSAWFSLIFIAVSWAAMLVSRDAGGSVHHTVLVWPFPQLFMAVVLASLPWKPIAGVIAVVMTGMNLLVMNQYIAEFERNGAAGTFDDALLALVRAIPDPPRLQAGRIYVLDWGMLNTLALFHQGRLPLFVADPPFLSDHRTPDELRDIEFMLHDPQGLFLAHLPAAEVNRGVGARFDQEIAARGLEKRVLKTIYDSNGRPVFEIFKLAAPRAGVAVTFCPKPRV